MFDRGLRNLCLVSGFAWRVGEQWVLLQREPLDTALPLRFAPGSATPKPGEPVDVAGQLVPDGGLHVKVTWWDRAALTSFPPALRWRVRGVSKAASINLAGTAVVMPRRDVSEGDRNVSNVVRAMLKPSTAWPGAVVEALERDSELAAWCEGTPYRYRLLNGVLITGWVDWAHVHTNPYTHAYYVVNLRIAPDPCPPVTVHVGRASQLGVRMARILRSLSHAPVTLAGRLTIKPVKDEEGHSIGTTAFVEATRLLQTTEDDIEAVPAWVLERKAG